MHHNSNQAPTGFKTIHGLVRCRFSLQQLRCNLCRLHISTRLTLDIHDSDRDLISFLTHVGYEPALGLQLGKSNVTVRDDFDPSITHDPTLVNESVNCKVQRARKNMPSDESASSCNDSSPPIYNAVISFFVQSGLIDLEYLASYDLASSYKYRYDISLTMYNFRR
ncbi:hypothetical protein G6F46_000492 [Rhizopus delemar]|nr:hypothetical protein G6F36_011859 [Rhizopus arrhizus]KAG1464811.1 hypothetical protein G6F55_001537 [Rhizopus delemar]KAG1497814.1 hypothetical protein G6F54_005508 [Rhizopus delemar]KAG1513861.1 hypothetical protein G6F53_004113 [Rhizopus delemar]KAG1526018.1 hypothetical protein G6F52_002811 [Rhizopus delemar]